ncbi:MAG: hypothetical protein U0228_24740 [Myxococcaceae bacterium]
MRTSALLACAALVCAVLAAPACSPVPTHEICGDGLDNDKNGFTDCDDTDCKGQPGCEPPNYGSCPKCSQVCTLQSACVTSWVDDRPIPLCTDGHCTALGTFIQPRVELDTRANWAGLTLSPQSAATRFIRKTANDGSAMTCARLATLAADRNAPSAIEDGNVAVVYGLDVTRVTNPQLGQGVNLAFVNTQTASDYLIWAELWGGPPGSSTKLPTGRRFGYGCFEDAATTPALTLQDNCPSATQDAGTCHIFHLMMPAPEMP